MDIFKNRNFTKIFAAAITSQLGTMVGNMAFVFYLLDRFSSQPSYVSIAEMMYALPSLFVFLFVGVLADRMDRLKIAEHSDWIRAGLTVILLAAILFNLFILIFMILFLRSAVSKFFIPAEGALIQGILTREQLVRAAGLNQMVNGVFVILSVGLGAAAYMYLGMVWTVILDGFSFVLSALLLRSCKIDEAVRLPNGRTAWTALSVKLITRDFIEGIRYILCNRLLMAIIIGFFVFGLINGALAVVPIFTLKYKISPEHYEGYIAMCAIFLGAGFILGSLLGSWVLQKVRIYKVVIFGLSLMTLLAIIFAMITNIWIYLLFVLITGISIAQVNVALGGWLPQLVDPSKMGRVGAWIEPIMMLAHSASLGLIALLYPRFITLEWIYYGLAACTFAVVVYYAWSLPKWSEPNPSMKAAEEDVWAG